MEEIEPELDRQLLVLIFEVNSLKNACKLLDDLFHLHHHSCLTSLLQKTNTRTLKRAFMQREGVRKKITYSTGQAERGQTSNSCKAIEED